MTRAGNGVVLSSTVQCAGVVVAVFRMNPRKPCAWNHHTGFVAHTSITRRRHAHAVCVVRVCVVVSPQADLNASITQFNCKSLLQDGTYVSTQDAKKAHKGPAPSVVTLTHTFSATETLTFEVGSGVHSFVLGCR
jgi:hypothetical protein